MWPEYVVIISDGKNEVEVPVSKEVFNFLVEADRYQMRIERKMKKYHEHYEMTDELLVFKKADAMDFLVEQEFFERENLKKFHRIIQSCSKTARRRFYMYVNGISFQKIADIEGCCKSSVYESVCSVRKKIVNNL